MRRIGGLIAAALGVAALAGCGSSASDGVVAAPKPAASSPPTHQAPPSAQPSCTSLVGEKLTRAIERVSCRDHGALQMTASVKCAGGTMVAFGNVVGGYIGKSVQAGNFADWPGC